MINIYNCLRGLTSHGEVAKGLGAGALHPKEGFGAAA